MRRLGVLATTAGTLGLLAPSAAAQEAPPAPGQNETKLKATMTAEEVVPQPGPGGGEGRVALSYVAADATLCYDFSLHRIGRPPTAAHIHQGAAGTAGPVVIDLRYAAHGEEGCIPVDTQKMNQVVAAPQNHYVDVHTRDHPDGAVRGQLEMDG